MAQAQVTITGVNGSFFTVHGRGAGAEGVRLGPNPNEAFYHMPVKTVWTETAYKPGATPSGVRFEPADLVLMFMLIPQPGQTWESVESAFLRAFAFDEDCTIGVQTEQSGLRQLRVRLLEAPKMDPEFDPHVDEYSEVVLTLRASDPFWWGPVRSQTVTPSTTDGAADVEFSNFGDREMWPVWEKKGTARYSIPDTSIYKERPRIITMPTSLTSASYVVDTDPHVEQVTSPGNPGAWAAMGVVRFVNPLPPGARFTLPVTWTGRSGSTSLTLLLRDRYSRPWG